MSYPHRSTVAVCLFDVEPEFERCVPAEHRDRARAALVLEALDVETGSTALDDLQPGETVVGLMLAHGSILHTVSFGGRELGELVLAGDMILPWTPTIEGIPSVRRLCPVVDSRVVALDHRFLRAAAAWPELMVTVQRRLNDQEHRTAVHGVIAQLPHVERRLLSIMWHLAGRVAKIGAEGTIVPLPMTHAELGRLVGAQRPTVTLALKELEQEGLLYRRDDGHWVLGPLEALERKGIPALLA